MNAEKPTPESEKEPQFHEKEVLPGGYYQPRGIEIKIGKRVEKLLERNPSPEMLSYAEALLGDMADDYRELGRQIASAINKQIKSLEELSCKIKQKQEK